MRNKLKNWRFALIGIFILQASLIPRLSGAAEATQKNKNSLKNQSPVAKKESSRQAASDESDVHVIVLDPDLAAEELESEGVEVHEGHSYENKRGQIPPKHHLEMIFAQSGVLPYVEKMDGMGRDMLFMRCEYSTLEQLKTLYPQIPKKKLSELKKRIFHYRDQGL